MSDEIKFELPDQVERCLAALSKMYERKGQSELQRIIVNSKTHMQEGMTYDNWNGGTYGHGLHLVLPETVFPVTVDDKTRIQDRIRTDLNNLHHVQNEFIESVFLEMETPDNLDWRKESGLQVPAKRLIPDSVQERIWGGAGYRVFLSHRSDVKRETADLKNSLRVYGISGFVAHTDIEPTQEWQNEIENALQSMHALVALLTVGFHDSNWTDQEVGVALGRSLPIVPVNLGRNPYGFIGKLQALPCTWEAAAKEIAKTLIRQSGMLNAYVEAVRECGNWDSGNALAALLPSITGVSARHVTDLISAYNNNGDVRASFGFNGRAPSAYGPGLIPHLTRWTGNQYRFSQDGKIQI